VKNLKDQWKPLKRIIIIYVQQNRVVCRFEDVGLLDLMVLNYFE
jgi:hypothetical protein